MNIKIFSDHNNIKIFCKGELLWKKKKKEKEDSTKYGEFVPTFFTWIGLDEQKEAAKKLENVTKKNKKN